MLYINTHYQHGHGGDGQMLIQSLTLSEHMHRQVVRGFSRKGTTVQPLNHSTTIYQWNSGHSSAELRNIAPTYTAPITIQECPHIPILSELGIYDISSM